MLAIGVDPVSGASIETNKDDYMPGEIVHLVLKGWAANEDVRLFMTEDPDTHGDVDTTVTVDANGEWSGHFYDVQEHDLGVTFTLTATGLTSVVPPQLYSPTTGQSPTSKYRDPSTLSVRWRAHGTISVPSGTTLTVRVTGTTDDPAAGVVPPR